MGLRASSEISMAGTDGTTTNMDHTARPGHPDRTTRMDHTNETGKTDETGDTDDMDDMDDTPVMYVQSSVAGRPRSSWSARWASARPR